MSFDFEFDGYSVTAEVDECRDGYGTGDSPTLYDVDILKLYDEDGEAVDVSMVSDRFYDLLVSEAISEYRGY